MYSISRHDGGSSHFGASLLRHMSSRPASLRVRTSFDKRILQLRARLYNNKNNINQSPRDIDSAIGDYNTGVERVRSTLIVNIFVTSVNSAVAFRGVGCGEGNFG